MNPNLDRKTTLGTVIESAERLAQNHHDRHVPVRDISFPAGLRFVDIAGDSYPLRENAKRQLSARLGIPYPYLTRCNFELQESNLNFWIRHEKNTELFFRFDASEVRAVFTPRYHCCDHVPLLRRLLDIGYHPDSRVIARMDRDFMSVSLHATERAFEVNGSGDKVIPGLSLSNSEIGLASVSVAAFMYRLVCSNGMIGQVSSSTSKRHVSSAILERLPDMAQTATRGLSSMRAQFNYSLQTPVEDVEATLERLTKKFLLTEEESAAVQSAFSLEPGETMFHMANSFTRAAQDIDLTAHASHKLERVGGQVINMVRPGGDAA